MALHINIEDLLSARIVESDRIAALAIPKRYRNRRLGDFLKELKLTEGHATGLPALKEAMKLNGSPDPVFDFDEERTWFQVLIPIHPNFVQKQLLFFDLNRVIWDISGIDRLLNEIIEKADIPQTKGIAGNQGGTIASNTHTIDNEAGGLIDKVDITIAGTIVNGIAGGIAGDVAEFVLIIDNQAIEAVGQIDRDVVGDIAGGIAGGIADKLQEVLMITKEPISRSTILRDLNLSNRAKNFETYIQPLVAINWLTMTIPNKPTSPKQQYLTTLKGRLILEFLKHKTNRTK